MWISCIWRWRWSGIWISEIAIYCRTLSDHRKCHYMVDGDFAENSHIISCPFSFSHLLHHLRLCPLPYPVRSWCLSLLPSMYLSLFPLVSSRPSSPSCSPQHQYLPPLFPATQPSPYHNSPAQPPAFRLLLLCRFDISDILLTRDRRF